MKTKLIIPVIDTEQGKFEYDGNLTTEAYGAMEYEHFRKTDRQVGRFVENMKRGISNVNTYGGGVYEIDNTEHPDLLFNNEDVEVIIYDAEMKEIDEDFIRKHTEKGDMFIIILNINPDTISPDSESELRYWMDDSISVIEDRMLPDEVKMRSLQGINYTIEIDGKPIILTNCKMVQNFSNKKNPFKFAIIVEKSIEK